MTLFLKSHLRIFLASTSVISSPKLNPSGLSDVSHVFPDLFFYAVMDSFHWTNSFSFITCFEGSDKKDYLSYVSINKLYFVLSCTNM